MRLKLLTASILALALTATPTLADPPGVALRAYTAGDYLAAASSAEAQASPTALVFAARALIAACMTSPQRRDVAALLDRAEDTAREGLRSDPSSVEARLLIAFSLGAKARRTSLADAIAHNYAPRGRRLIQDALTRAPTNAQAHAMLGAWHLEVLRRGGRTGARLYGARLETGINEFERAHTLAPNDRLISIQYGIALLQLDPELYRSRVASLLAAANSTPADAFETHAFAQARHISQVLTEDGPRAAEAASRAAFL